MSNTVSANTNIIRLYSMAKSMQKGLEIFLKTLGGFEVMREPIRPDSSDIDGFKGAKRSARNESGFGNPLYFHFGAVREDPFGDEGNLEQ